MDYKKVLRLHYVNRLSGREIAESCGDCGKRSVNEFLKRFRECQELSYPLPAKVSIIGLSSDGEYNYVELL